MTIRPGTDTTRGSRRRGVTLVEALATVVVIGIALPAIMQALSLSTRTAGYARQKAIATTLADGKLAEIVANGAWQSDEAGNFGDSSPDFSFQTQAVDWPTQAGVYEVTVEVSWAESGGVYSVRVCTLVYPASTTSTASAAGIAEAMPAGGTALAAGGAR